MCKLMLNLYNLHKLQVLEQYHQHKVNNNNNNNSNNDQLLKLNEVDVENVNVFNAVVRQQVQVALDQRVQLLVVEQKVQLEQARINNILAKVVMTQIMPHLEVLLVVNDDKVVIEDKSFDYLIKLKDKYGKYAVVY